MYNKDVLPVVNYLQNYSLEKLTEDFGVKVKDYGQFVVLNYCQISTPKTDPRWWDCRGLILEKDTWKVLRRPFSRFFNLGETFESNSFPFERSITYSKVDGSLFPVFFNPYDNRYEAGTRQMAFGEGTTTFGNSFRQLFLDGGFNGYEDAFQEALTHLNIDFPEMTWIFEMTSPETRVVTPYTEKNIWFLAARHNLTGQYLMAGAIKDYLLDIIPTLKFPEEYHFSNPQDCVKAANDLPNLEEGYVVYDPVTQSRVKIKSAVYVAIHHMHDNGAASPKRIMSLILENEHEEYLTYFPEDSDTFAPYIRKFEELKVWIHNTYEDIKGIESQKNFALEACKTPFSGILFEMRGKKMTIMECLKKMHIDKLVEIVTILK